MLFTFCGWFIFMIYFLMNTNNKRFMAIFFICFLLQHFKLFSLITLCQNRKEKKCKYSKTVRNEFQKKKQNFNSLIKFYVKMWQTRHNKNKNIRFIIKSVVAFAWIVPSFGIMPCTNTHTERETERKRERVRSSLTQSDRQYFSVVNL